MLHRTLGKVRGDRITDCPQFGIFEQPRDNSRIVGKPEVNTCPVEESSARAEMLKGTE
jgi:hypothetical protein